MIAQTRTDLFLAKITGEDVALPVPQTRFELYLANIAGESYELPAPNSRATLYLAKILGQDVELPEPQTRSELYLASIAGMSVQLPEAPQTREEWYLAKWAEDAGYVVITGNPVTFNAVAAKLRQLKIAFSPVQEGSGDPSPENQRPISGWTGVNVWQRGKNLLNIAMLGEATGWTVDENGDYKGTSSDLLRKYGKDYGGLIDFGENGFSERLRLQINYKQSSDGGGVSFRFVYTDGTESGATASGTTDFVWKGWNSTEGKTIRSIYFTYGSSKMLTVHKFGLYLYQAGYTADDYDTPYNPASRSISITFPALGANQWDEQWEVGGISSQDGQDVSQNNTIRGISYIPVVGGESYYIKCPQASSAYLFFYDSSKAYIGSSGGYKTGEQTVPSGAAFMRFQMSSAYGTTYNHDIAINYPSTVTTYSPYTNICSGTLDLVTGVLTVTHVSHPINVSTSWEYYANGGYFRTSSATISALGLDSSEAPICEEYLGVKTISSSTANNRIGYASGPRIAVKDSRYTNVTDWIADVGDAIFVAKLANPVTIQLTPQQINSLAGANTMWSDANGDITVEYRKDGNVSDVEALSMLLGGRYTPAQGPDDVPDREALRIITGR